MYLSIRPLRTEVTDNYIYATSNNYDLRCRFNTVRISVT